MTHVDDLYAGFEVETAAANGNGAGGPRLQPVPDDPTLRPLYTDVGNGLRLINTFGHKLRHVGPWQTWFIWDGRRWQADTRGDIYELAKQTARSIWTEPSNDRKALVRWALQSEGAGKVRAMVDMARTDERVAIDPQQLDADRWLLSVGNATIDLRTGRTRPHAQADLITKIAAVTHDPNATAPRFEQFLERVLPDVEVRDFLQRWVGYCLTGVVSEHKIVFAYGAGANGKSTLLNVLAHVLGDYARQAAPDLLMRRRDDPHPTGLADLQGARLVLAAETAEGRRLDEALVKRLTGGDRIKARLMFRDFFEFDPTHKFVVATNHRPEIAGTDHGIWRRIRLIPFTVVIPDDEQDHGLEHDLVKEASGILNWAIAGCQLWKANGLTDPTAIVAATAEYRAAMDVLGDYISDCCVLHVAVNARAGDLYKNYTQWCETTGERPLAQRRFGMALSERGLDKYRNNGICWAGIGLRTLDSGPSTEPSRDDGHDESPGQRLDLQ